MSTAAFQPGPTALVVEKVYSSPAEKIWSALTDPKKMKEWYFEIPDFRAEVGFSFSFAAGAEDKLYVHECVVTQVIPGKKLAYSWRYKDFPGMSEVSFELFPEGATTRVVVTHTGLDSFPRDDKNFARESFQGGWEYIFGTSLMKYLAAE